MFTDFGEAGLVTAGAAGRGATIAKRTFIVANIVDGGDQYTGGDVVRTGVDFVVGQRINGASRSGEESTMWNMAYQTATRLVGH